MSSRVTPERPCVKVSTLAQQVTDHLNTVLIITRTYKIGSQILVEQILFDSLNSLKNHLISLVFGIILNLYQFQIEFSACN